MVKEFNYTYVGFEVNRKVGHRGGGLHASFAVAIKGTALRAFLLELQD
jgi:hypothetical protein